MTYHKRWKIISSRISQKSIPGAEISSLVFEKYIVIMKIVDVDI